MAGGFAPELSGVVPVAAPADLPDWLSLTWELCNARAASKTGFILFAPYTITARSRSAAKIVPTMLFFLGGSTGSGGGAMVPVRRTTGVCPGEAARALRERAVAITVGSSSTGLWPTSPRPPALPVAMVAAGELPPITIVELGFPPGGALRAVIPQVLEHFPAALIALFRLFRQGFHHYGADSGMNRGINLTRRNGFLVDNFVDDRGDVLSRERLFAGNHFIEHDAERKNIAAAIHRAALHLFGRHITGRAHNVRGLLRGAKLKNLSGAEVGNFDGVVGSEHQVGGLNVAVNDVAFMGELQSVAGLIQDAQGAGQRERVSAIQKSLEALAFHQFHGDVVQPVFFAGVEDHHDIGVSEQAGGACFGLEPRQEFVMLQAGTFFA